MKNQRHKILRKFFFEKINLGMTIAQSESVFNFYKRAIAGELNKLAKEFYNSKNKPALYKKYWKNEAVIGVFDYFRFISRLQII